MVVKVIGIFLVFSPPTALLYLCRKITAMATNITTPFDSYYLTAHLPETVYIGTSATQLTVMVSIGNNVIFSSVFYPFNSVVALKDLRSIVEAEMYEQGYDIAPLEIEAMEPGGASAVISDVQVMCSDFKYPYGSESFMRLNFLTTRKSAVIPTSGHVLLHYLAIANEQGSNYMRIHYSRPFIPNTFFEYTYTKPKILSTTTQIMMEQMDYDTFRQILDNQGFSNSTIHYVEIVYGSRRFTLFFTDEVPLLKLSFRTSLNLFETAYIYGVTTEKTTVDRSEAVIGRKTQFYDQTVTTKHEVETASLPKEEAEWLKQMFSSKEVLHLLPNDVQSKVLISDITSEITDSDKELTKFKFSFRYEDNTEWME